MKEKGIDEELDFVLRHYEQERFDPEKAMKRLERPARRKPLRRWVAVAASLLCLTVLAAVFVWRSVQPSATSAMDVPSATSAPTTAAVQASASFHFDATPLPEVLEALGQHYGVQLTATDTTRCLTGDFIGESLDEILSMIEDVLGVNISQNGKKFVTSRPDS